MNEGSDGRLSCFAGDKHHSKMGGFVGAFFHAFHWNRKLSGAGLLSHKLLLSGRPKKDKKRQQQEQEEERSSMANLALIGSEKRGDFSNENVAPKKVKKPGLVARLMGLESMPASDPLVSQKLGHLVDHALHINGFVKKPSKMQPQKLAKPFTITETSIICKASPSPSQQHEPFLSHLNLASPCKNPRGAKGSLKLIETAVKLLEPGMKASATRQLLTDPRVDKQAKTEGAALKIKASSRPLLNTEQGRPRSNVQAAGEKKRGRAVTMSPSPQGFNKAPAMSRSMKSGEMPCTGPKPNGIKDQLSRPTMAATKQKPRPVPAMAPSKPKNAADVSRKARQLEAVNKKAPESRLDRGTSKESRSKSIAKISGEWAMTSIHDLRTNLNLSTATCAADDSKAHSSPISIMDPPFYDGSSTSSEVFDVIAGSKLEMADHMELTLDEQDLRWQKQVVDPTLLMSLERRLAENGWSFPVAKGLEEGEDIEEAQEGVAWQNRRLIVECANEILGSKVGTCSEALVLGGRLCLERVIWKQIQKWKAMADGGLMVEEVVENETVNGWKTLGEKIEELVQEISLGLLEWLIEELVFDIAHHMTHTQRP